VVSIDGFVPPVRHVKPSFLNDRNQPIASAYLNLHYSTVSVIVRKVKIKDLTPSCVTPGFLIKISAFVFHELLNRTPIYGCLATWQ